MPLKKPIHMGSYLFAIAERAGFTVTDDSAGRIIICTPAGEDITTAFINYSFGVLRHVAQEADEPPLH